MALYTRPLHGDLKLGSAHGDDQFHFLNAPLSIGHFRFKRQGKLIRMKQIN